MTGTTINTEIFNFEPPPHQTPMTDQGLMLSAQGLLSGSSSNLNPMDLNSMLNTLTPLPANIAASASGFLMGIQMNPAGITLLNSQPESVALASIESQTGLNASDASTLLSWLNQRNALYGAYMQLAGNYLNSITQNTTMTSTTTTELSVGFVDTGISYQTKSSTMSAYGQQMISQIPSVMQGAGALFFSASTQQLETSPLFSLLFVGQAGQINSMLLSELISKVSANPSQYHVSASNVNTLISNLKATASSGSDTVFSKFVSIITSYQQTNGPSPTVAGNPLDSLINSMYTDTIQQQIANVDDTLNYVDPTHAHVPPPDYTLIQQDFGVNLNAPENQALFQQLLQQYAATNGLSQKEIQELMKAHNDPSYSNAWAQKTNIKLMAELLATLASQGQINITAAMYQSMLAQLPPDIQKEVAALESSGAGGLNLSNMTAVIGAILVAGATQVSNLSTVVSSDTRLNQLIEINGTLIMGATAALDKIMHPDAVVLLDFLGEVAKFTLKYRNEMMKVMMEDVAINKAANIAKRDMVQSQMQQIAKGIDKHKDQFRKEAAAKKAMEAGGIGMIIGGALLAALGAVIAAGLAFTGIGLAGGAALVAVGAGMIAGGGMMLAASQGKDVGAAAMSGMDDNGKNAMMGGMIALTVCAAILTVLTCGATAPLFAVGGAVVASVTAAVSSAIWGARVQELMAQSFQNNQGMSQKDSMICSAAMVALINLAIIALTLGGAAATSAINGILAESRSLIVSSVDNATMTQSSMTATEVASKFFSNMGKSLAAMFRSGANETSVAGSTASSGASAGRGLASLLNCTGENAPRAATLLEVVAAAVSTAFEAAASVESAIYDEASADAQAVQATIDELQILISTCMNVMSQMINAISSGQSSMMSQINELSQNFQEAVQNLMQAVTAITSNQAAPQAAATGGGGPPEDSQNIKESSSSQKKSKNVTLDDVIATSCPQATSAFTIAGIATSGIESSVMSSTKPRNFAALLTFMRALGKAIGEMLKQAGLPPKLAEGMGMKMAADMLMQMKMLASGQMDSSKEAQEAMGKNPMLLTLTLLLNKKGVSQKDFDLQKLMEASPDSKVMDDATLGELLKMLEELAKNDPELQSLVVKFKKLMEKKSGNAAEFSFEILQLFSDEVGMKNFDFDGLGSLMGASMEGDVSLKMLQTGDEDLGDLVNEYFMENSTQPADSAVVV